MLLSELLTKQLHLDLSAYIAAFSCLLFLSALLVQLFLDEYPLEPEEEFDSMDGFVRVKWGHIMEVLSCSKRIMAIIELALLGSFYSSLLLWFPYYFEFIGYKQYSNYLSMLSPVVFFLGAVALEYLLSCCRSINH